MATFRTTHHSPDHDKPYNIEQTDTARVMASVVNTLSMFKAGDTYPYTITIDINGGIRPDNADTIEGLRNHVDTLQKQNDTLRNDLALATLRERLNTIPSDVREQLAEYKRDVDSLANEVDRLTAEKNRLIDDLIYSREANKTRQLTINNLRKESADNERAFTQRVSRLRDAKDTEIERLKALLNNAYDDIQTQDT